MDHSPGFLKVVAEARARVREVTVDQAKAILGANPDAILLDVREDCEWQAGRAQQAQHLGKGILERDIENKIPNIDAEIIMYCGGGYRSILSAEIAQRMGYRRVASLIGGYKAMTQAQWPIVR